MPSSTKIAIVAALEREVHSLVKEWQVRQREFAGRNFRFYENGNATVVCSGIGQDAARRATEAVIALYNPGTVFSVGFAGAVDGSLQVGALVNPARVIDAKDGSVVNTRGGQGTLVSVSRVADAAQKARLAELYSAVAVDMEAVAVARVAGAHDVAFEAVKVISDEHDAKLSSMAEFILEDGRFRAAAFGFHVAFRPWLWTSVIELARNSAKAAAVLANQLAGAIASGVRADKIDKPQPLQHQTSDELVAAHSGEKANR
jgi:nucleoside phosphorylase